MHLDLATTSMLAGMALNETPALNTLTPEEARLVFTEINRSMPPGPEQVSSEDCQIPVEGGAIRGTHPSPLNDREEHHGLLPWWWLGNR
jgi:hypothetical protein